MVQSHNVGAVESWKQVLNLYGLCAGLSPCSKGLKKLIQTFLSNNLKFSYLMQSTQGGLKRKKTRYAQILTSGRPKPVAVLLVFVS